MCVFGMTAARINFDRIDFNKKSVECELICVWIHLFKSDSYELMLFE